MQDGSSRDGPRTFILLRGSSRVSQHAIRFLNHQMFCNCIAVTGVLLDHFSTHKCLLLIASGRATSFQTTADSWNEQELLRKSCDSFCMYLKVQSKSSTFSALSHPDSQQCQRASQSVGESQWVGFAFGLNTPQDQCSGVYMQIKCKQGHRSQDVQDN